MKLEILRRKIGKFKICPLLRVIVNGLGIILSGIGRYQIFEVPNMNGSRRYDNDEGCLMRSSFTRFYMRIQLPQCVFRTAKVSIAIYRLFTVGSRYLYFWQEPAVRRTNPPLNIILEVVFGLYQKSS